jgi:hypothetical protein
MSHPDREKRYKPSRELQTPLKSLCRIDYGASVQGTGSESDWKNKPATIGAIKAGKIITTNVAMYENKSLGSTGSGLDRER